MLVVLTGLPGTGKSTIAKAIARELPAAYLAVDPVFGVLERTTDIAREDPLGKVPYEIVVKLAEMQLAVGVSAVIDAVNPFDWGRARYRELAATHGASCALIHTTCTDGDLHRRRIAERRERGAGADWSEVVRQLGYYEPPQDATIAVDAASPPADNLRAVLQEVRANL